MVDKRHLLNVLEANTSNREQFIKAYHISTSYGKMVRCVCMVRLCIYKTQFPQVFSFF